MPNAFQKPSPAAGTIGRDRSPLPPAVWTSFAQQIRWKSWALVALLGVIFAQAIAMVALAKKEPDVVLVTDDGKSTFVNRKVAGASLMRFLSEQRHEPSNVTVLHFTRTFLDAFLAANSSTIDDALPQALSMMSAGLRARFAKEAEKQKLVETVKAARVSTRLTFESLTLEERQGNLLRVRATVLRSKTSLVGAAAPPPDRLQIELIERILPRSIETPDGLEIADYSNKVL